MNSKTFLKIWFFSLIALMTMAMGLSYVIDPYNLVGSPRIAGINKIKPYAGLHSHQSKIHTAHRQEPDVLIIGNSRPEMGIDPDHEYFQENQLSSYNLAMPGASLEQQYGYAIDVLRSKNVKSVIIGVDFLDYLIRQNDDVTTNPYQWPPAYSESSDRKKADWDGNPNPRHTLNYMNDVYFPLISLDTLQDSIFTLINQSSQKSNLLENGFNPAAGMNNATRNEGVKVIFDQKMPTLIEGFNGSKKSIYQNKQQWSQRFELLDYLLRYLNKNDIDAKLFINPYHIQYLEVIDHSGLTNEFLEWKRMIVEIVSRYQDTSNMILWDFSAPSAYTAEPFLEAKREPLDWFWEPAHYNKALGDIIVNRMFKIADNSAEHKNFGIIITRDNIENHIAEHLTKLNEFREQYPTEAKYALRFFKDR